MHRSVAIIAFAFWQVTTIEPVHGGNENQDGTSGTLQAIEYARTIIYHSPQKPGFTSWTGAWMMPDGSMMVSFTEATGPVNDRPKTPPEIRKRLSWPPNDSYDMNGLDLRNVHLHSIDAGKTWKQVSADPFRSPMNGVTCMAETALTDGTIIRGVWGFYLPFDNKLPPTGFVQRSHDKTNTWSEPIVLLDPNKCMTFPTRLRQLRDGRLLLLGGISRAPATGEFTRQDHWELLEPLMMISSDGGKSWEGPLDVVPEEYRKDWRGEEYDAAELPNGDLLCVFRRELSTGSVRWQGLLKKDGDRWKPQNVGPSQLPPLSHPELLPIREGVVLHIAPTGYYWTDDAGTLWHKLELPGSAYYARSVQTADGRIYAFGHVGDDNGYGLVDQSIVMDSFRLTRK